MKVIVIGGKSQSLVNFRGPLLYAMREGGHEVLACAGEPEKYVTEHLRGWGIRFAAIHLARAGMRPWEDLRTYWELYHLMRQFQPDVVLAYTIKPVIWGSLAARWAGIPGMYSLITGLGYAFISGDGLRGKVVGWIATMLYRLSLRNCRLIVFQNPDDIEEFTNRGLVKKEKCLLVNGSGVDLEHYGFATIHASLCFLMAGRLLKDKGVLEYVQSAQIIRERYPEAKFALAGPLDSNPASINRVKLDQWVKGGLINYLGVLDDVRPAFTDCSIYVLPSYYREGTPRTVLEAMSVGRPIITTNEPGCRETIRMPSGRLLDKDSKEIIRGENGFLVPAKNVEKLVQAMEQFINHPELIQQMGLRSRKIAEEKYDVHQVNAVILQAMGLE